MTSRPLIRWGTNLITFFNTEYWELGKELPYPAWSAAFNSNPRVYFDSMLDTVRDAGLEGVEIRHPVELIAEAIGAPHGR